MQKFFIIIPTLNSYESLPKLINSLNLQTYKNWRVLFVDGNSKKNHRIYLKNLCSENPNFDFIYQEEKHPGIYGAMNQGIKYANQDEWIFFWGSDDWVIEANTLLDINSYLNKNDLKNLDLLIFSARYFNNKTNKISRNISFSKSKVKIFNSKSYKKEIFIGNSPPHQATLFGPKLIKRNIFFVEELMIAADLHFFLRLTSFKNLLVKHIKKEIIFLGNEGISNKKVFQKLKEVYKVYREFYKNYFFIPFFMRYLRKFLIIIQEKN